MCTMEVYYNTTTMNTLKVTLEYPKYCDDCTKKWNTWRRMRRHIFPNIKDKEYAANKKSRIMKKIKDTQHGK